MSGESGALFFCVFFPGIIVGYLLRSAVTAWRQATAAQRHVDELAQARRHRTPGGAA